MKDASRIPIAERLAWDLEQAAQVYSLDGKGVRAAAASGDLDTFRPGRRKVSRAAMDRWIKSMEE